MNKIWTLFILMGTMVSCTKEPATLNVTSPSGNNAIHFHLSQDGTPYYLVRHGEKTVIDSSAMGFDFKDQEPLKSGLNLVSSTQNTLNETWEMPWGEQREVVNHYNEMVVTLEESAAPNRQFNIYFRAYDDGIGFRYEFLPQQDRDSIIIMDENTEFQLTEDYTTWWIPGDWDIYEHLYNTTKVSEIDALSKRNNADLAATYIPENAVNTPVTMRGEDGLHLSFHEANLTDYAGMSLKVDTES